MPCALFDQRTHIDRAALSGDPVDRQGTLIDGSQGAATLGYGWLSIVQAATSPALTAATGRGTVWGIRAMRRSRSAAVLGQSRSLAAVIARLPDQCSA